MKLVQMSIVNILKDITPGEPKEVDEASARADAMRAMRRDKKVDPADC